LQKTAPEGGFLLSQHEYANERGENEDPPESGRVFLFVLEAVAAAQFFSAAALYALSLVFPGCTHDKFLSE